MTLRLIDLEAPLDDVEFPNGATHVPVPFGPNEYRLWREMPTEPDAMTRGKMLLQIVTACYPKATVDDIDSCTPKMLIAMAAHAGRKIEQIRDALKNVDVAAGVETAPTTTEPPPATPPLSPKPSGSTSSRATRKRSGKTRGASTTASPTDGQSSSGTGTTTSKNPDESTPFSVNWTTSTERTSQATP